MKIPDIDLAYAHGGPCGTGKIRHVAEDFRVIEIPGFEPDGQGDHVYLTIEKKDLTTQAVSNRLRDYCQVKSRDVGYAGMKDRHAVTRQNFSINLAGKSEPDWAALVSENLKVLAVSRHPRKLKKGVLKGNRFELVVRDMSADHDCLQNRLQKISQQGVPNYFGDQRFGIEGKNLDKAAVLFSGENIHIDRHERGMLFSSVRSKLFNALLAERVSQHNWHRLLAGEVISLDGTARHFHEPIDDILIERAERLDVHGTGPLPGLESRAIEPDDEAGKVEQHVMQHYADWLEGLQRFKLEHARRPLRVAVRDLQWSIEEDQLFLSFSLTAGAYATVVLREILAVTQ